MSILFEFVQYLCIELLAGGILSLFTHKYLFHIMNLGSYSIPVFQGRRRRVMHLKDRERPSLGKKDKAQLLQQGLASLCSLQHSYPARGDDTAPWDSVLPECAKEI